MMKMNVKLTGWSDPFGKAVTGVNRLEGLPDKIYKSVVRQIAGSRYDDAFRLVEALEELFEGFRIETGNVLTATNDLAT